MKPCLDPHVAQPRAVAMLTSRPGQATIRVILWAALWFAGLTFAAGDPATQMEERIDSAVAAHLPKAVEDLRAWIAYPTETLEGDTHRADKTALLQAIVARAQLLGLASRLVADDRAAIVDLGDLRDPARGIGILVHADVVPALGEAGWQHPPYAAVLMDGVVHGRGAADDKGPIAASLHAMAIVKELGVPLDRGVRLIIGTSEEDLNWADMAAVADAGLVPAQGWTADAAFPVVNAEKSFINATIDFPATPAEKAGGITGLRGGSAPNAVPAEAETRLGKDADGSLRQRVQKAIDAYPKSADSLPGFELQLVDGEAILSARGKAAHGSRPGEGVNAISHLAVLLANAGVLAPAGDVSSGSGVRALGFINAVFGTASDGAKLGIFRRHPVMGDTTVNLGMVATMPDRVSLKLNIRGPDGLDVATVERALRDAAAPFDAEVALDAAMEPLWVNPDTPLVRQLLESYQAVTGYEGEPLAIGGTTYAKAFPGYVAFGMGFPDESGPVHAPNERLSLDHLRLGMRIYVDAILRLAGRSGGET